MLLIERHAMWQGAECWPAGDPAAATTATATNGKRDSAAPNQQGLLPPLPASPLATYHAVSPIPGAAAAVGAAADDAPGGGNWGEAPVEDPVQEAEAAGPDDALGGEHVDLLKLGEEGRSPDLIADDILAMKESHRSKEQLLLLYKTCRYMSTHTAVCTCTLSVDTSRALRAPVAS